MIGLTPRQAACLAAIKRLTRDDMPPSYEELQLALGLASKSAVHRLVHGLKQRGAVDLHPNAVRSIRVLHDPGDLASLGERTTEHLRALRDRIDEILKARAQ